LLVAIAFWTWLWGAVGLVLATPLTVCIGVLGRYIPQLEFLGVLLGDEPVMEVPTNYYQRLVAHDEDEATAQVEDYLQTHSFEELCDDVFIPALSAAKRDHELGVLTEEDVQFIIQVTRRIVEEFGTQLSQPLTSAHLLTTAAAKAPAEPTQRASILGCPAHDEADELALQVLQQVLEPQHYDITLVSSEMLPGEVLSVVEHQHIGLVCIAAVAPGALAPVRYLCKRLRARYPECRIVVGRWGTEAEESARAEARLRDIGVEEVGTTIRETANRISQLSQLASSAS
jgi:CheY-like chemotaxis protein